MEKTKHDPEKVMQLKESNQLLAEVLYTDGIDIYKRSRGELKDLEPTIANTRLKIDAILKERFQTSFQELNGLPPERLQEIRESFLGYYQGSVEKAEKLKKWIPLNQLVGYTEVLVASAYMKLNNQIDADINADIESNLFLDSTQSTPTEYLRMKILNAFKRVNQGKTWEDIQREVTDYLENASVGKPDELFEKWRVTFEEINHPLQQLYGEHVETMQINDAIYDLQLREKKRSQVIQNLVGEAKRNWKPADLEHDIHSQSAEVNRSVIELVCNGIDANDPEKNEVDVLMDEGGYSVRDHGNGMNPYVILEKLMIPKVSGKTGKETIGRFGVGFYTVLSHLKTKGDLVRIETSDGKTGYVIEFKIHERTGDIFCHTEGNDQLEKGTNITVKTKEFDNEDAEKLCKELLSYNGRSDITLNGETVNQNEGFKDIKGENVSVKYSQEVSDESKVSLMVNGVVIEQINISGENLCKEMALDFPLTCSLPESRSELSVDAVAIDSVKEIIATICSAGINEEEKMSVCNALYPVLEKLQARSKSNKRADNMLVCLQDEFKNSVEMEGKIFLPNTKAFLVLNIENAIYLDSRVCEVNLEKIPGVAKCDRFESPEGYELFIADFKEGVDEFVVEDGKRLVIDRKVYESHKDNPAALNVYFSNLDSTGQNTKEKTKGRILTQEKSGNVMQEKIFYEGAEVKITREAIDMMGSFRIPPDQMTQDQIYEFVNFSEADQLEYIKQAVLSGMEINEKQEERDSFHKKWEMDDMGLYYEKEKPHGEKSKIFEVVRSIIEQYDIDAWDQKIKEVEQSESAHITFGNRAYYSKGLYKESKLIRRNPLIIGRLFSWKEQFTQDKQYDSPYYDSPYYEKYFLRDFLHDLDAIYDTVLLEKEFKDYSEEVLYNFFSFVRNIQGHVPNENKQAIYERSKEIFLLKIAKLSLPEQQKVLEEFVQFTNYKGNPIALAYRGNYQNIPRAVRGYAMYIVEGGEILNEKGFDEANIEQSEYQAQIPLSTLVQAKKDHEQYFQDFAGTPAELMAHARDSQKGIDPSKAIRDIMHSAENQIVNDGYLWIREVLQNSLDAVKQNKDQFSQIPTVSIDTYLRKKTREVPEYQLWDMLQTEIEKQYPDHFLYFKDIISKSVSTLTTENFVSALDALAEATNGKQNYFGKSFIGDLKIQFETAVLSEPDLVVEAQDPVGMDLHTVINYLLIPNESSKKYDEEAVGKFGQGFFTIFGDAKEVLIKTSKGDLRTEYIKIEPIKDQSGKIIDFSVAMSWRAEDFKGTVIQKVVDTDMPQVEAAFCKSAVVSYGGLIDRKAVQLDFRGQEINKPRTILSESEIAGLGSVKIYDANENAMTQNGLFIKEMDEEILSGIPENLRKIMQKNGIILDIPASIKLIKSRGDIAQKKDVMPLLKEQMPSLVLKAYLSLVMGGKAELENIPYDYFEDKRSRLVSEHIKNDAQKLAKGDPLKNYELYLENEDAIIQLLTLLPCIEVRGSMMSIFELANKISKDPKSVDITKLPQSIQEKIKYATTKQDDHKQNQQKAKQEYGVNETTIMQDRKLPEIPALKETASVYYAYDKLVKFIFKHTDALDVEPSYYLEIGQSNAHAFQNTDSIGFNLDYLEKKLPLLAEIIDQKLPATDAKVQRFLEEAMSLCTHERQHNLEGSEEGQWTHNDVFFEGQRKVIAKFIKDQSVNIQAFLDQIYAEFTPSLISAKQLIGQM